MKLRSCWYCSPVESMPDNTHNYTHAHAGAPTHTHITHTAWINVVHLVRMAIDAGIRYAMSGCQWFGGLVAGRLGLKLGARSFALVTRCDSL